MSCFGIWHVALHLRPEPLALQSTSRSSIRADFADLMRSFENRAGQSYARDASPKAYSSEIPLAPSGSVNEPVRGS